MPVAVDDDHRVGRGFQQPADPRVGAARIGVAREGARDRDERDLPAGIDHADDRQVLFAGGVMGDRDAALGRTLLARRCDRGADGPAGVGSVDQRLERAADGGGSVEPEHPTRGVVPRQDGPLRGDRDERAGGRGRLDP